GLFRVREAVFLSAAAALCSAPGVTAALAAGALSSGLVFWLLSFFDSTLFPLWRDWVRAYRGEHAVVIGTITDHDVGAAQLCGKRRHPRSRHPAAPVPLLLPGGSGGLTPVLQRLTTEYDYSPTIPGQRRQSVSQTRGLPPAIQLQQIHPATAAGAPARPGGCPRRYSSSRSTRPPAGRMVKDRCSRPPCPRQISTRRSGRLSSSSQIGKRNSASLSWPSRGYCTDNP